MTESNEEVKNADTETMVYMKERDLKGIMRQTVHDTLTSLGIEHNEPFEMQKDMQHLREQRVNTEEFKRKAGKTMVGFAVVSLLGAVSLALKEYFKN